ncbi:hypothetical protein KAM448_36680 [Aeromonas caviae]|uniref:Uncharacterized protein n=1 Tax=Aeromonas caviae TaxID=648 RepID=A0ABD0B8L0_AERCA|nr:MULTISPECIES: hypothetical protein [Aeromonas]BCK65859.1 hypothetical protein KAM330_48480 [Aeromonas hydrophila]BCR31450.1 hypothetical protein KAM376_44560 [Aeromonas caviae]GJA71886.1 hypothetical protein KAM353_15330 [Aeromonas caviae]GJA81645.1 hypothetical protein KAM355_22050 [Aeromonas caviae]GJB00137.1 hypothetical protein KAM359_35440 [Aeromonas caviae]
MWQLIVFFYAPIAVIGYAFYDKFPLKDFGLYMTMLITFLMVCFMYHAMPYSPGVIVRTEGEPLPSRKQKIGKWFRERFLVFVSLVFIFESILLIAWSFAKEIQ